jgi:hypothetical protein
MENDPISTNSKPLQEVSIELDEIHHKFIISLPKINPIACSLSKIMDAFILA